MCFNDWNIKVCEELARFGTMPEKLTKHRFPWGKWWALGLPPEEAARKAICMNGDVSAKTGKPDTSSMNGR